MLIMYDVANEGHVIIASAKGSVTSGEFVEASGVSKTHVDNAIDQRKNSLVSRMQRIENKNAF